MYLPLILLALLATTAQADTLGGRVGSIVDGDTLILTNANNQQQRIHLAGIDAPEVTQPFGQNAKTGLSALTFGQQTTANCTFGNTPNERRCVLRVEGKDVGLEMLRAGLAWWDRQNSALLTAQERADYEHAEFIAKIHRAGLWNSKTPTPPWEWRHGRPDS